MKSKTNSVSCDSLTTREPDKKNRGIVCYKIGQHKIAEETTIIEGGRRFRRGSSRSREGNLEIVSDYFADNSQCEFVRIESRGAKEFILILPFDYELTMTEGSGMLLRGQSADRSNYWIPLYPIARSYDRLWRIRAENRLKLTNFDLSAKQLCASLRSDKTYDFFEIIVWTLPPGSDLFEDLQRLSGWEMQKIFLWGSHTHYTGPKDVYRHVVHGRIYENRWSAPRFVWKAFAEVDAFSLFNVLNAFRKTTGKKIYEHLKTQVVYSVVCGQNGDGAWRQGLNTEVLEEHYRYQCSAIHMLAADYEQTKDAVIMSVLEKGVDYLKGQCEKLTIGTWYLHDSLEKCGAHGGSAGAFLDKHKFGESIGNMLVLNTHIDAILALRRYDEAIGLNRHEKDIISAYNAAIAVLKLRNAGWIYRFLFFFIEASFYPSSNFKRYLLSLRVRRRLARKYFIALLPIIKRIYPRLVMPNGYIDRDLYKRHFCYEYHAINTMDLLRLRSKFGGKIVDKIIDDAINLVKRVRLFEQWAESEDTKFAVCFWAEAMYLECLLNRKQDRAIMAAVLMSILDSGQGMPPSLLGFNSEYIPLSDQIAYRGFNNDCVCAVNLSVNKESIEFLFINNTDQLQEVEINDNLNQCKVYTKENKCLMVGGAMAVPPRSWVRLMS